MFGFARLLLVISFGYAMITFYESPVPGLGSSFSNLITDQTAYLARILSARSVQNAQQSLNTLWNALEQPDPWSILANLLYWLMLIVIGLAQFALLFVVSFGMIASAVCALLGPLFIPFFIVPTLEWLFWNWLKLLSCTSSPPTDNTYANTKAVMPMVLCISIPPSVVDFHVNQDGFPVALEKFWAVRPLNHHHYTDTSHRDMLLMH